MKSGLLSLQTAWGIIRVEISAAGVVCLRLPEVRGEGRTFSLGESTFEGEGEVLTVAERADAFLRDTLSGRRCESPPWIWPPASDFTKKIWDQILMIPRGETATYGEIAARAGFPRAARAAGRAAGMNRLPLIIPCHRVVPASGGLGGFSSGRAWKRLLLGLEGAGLRAGGR